MTAVMRALVYDWARPRMNAHDFFVSAFVGNRGSVRVFEKIGFTPLPDVQNVVRLNETRGGRIMSLHRLELHLE